MKQKILITGASGYTGLKLVAFLEKHNFHLVSVIRKSTSQDKIELLKKYSQVYFYDGNYESVEVIFKDQSIDAVIHLAALARYDYIPAEIDKMIDSNFRMGVHILEAMANSSCKKLINFSTYWQENENNHAICLYAALKQAFEGMINFYSFDKNINAISLRVTDIYGPDDNRGKLFSQLKNYQSCEKFKMSKGEQEINLIYIDDVLSAIIECLNNFDKNPQHLVYYLCGNQTFTLRQIVEIYNQETGKNIMVSWGSLPYRKNQIMKIKHGKSLPGFKAKYNLKDVVKYL